MNTLLLFFNGFFLGLGLIVAIGAQNAWVLGMSLRGIHPWPIAITCFLIDGILMAVGVVFFKEIQVMLPSVVPWLTYLGVVMLLWLALQAMIRVVHGQSGLKAEQNTTKTSLPTAVLTALAISLLNPHVYLDTVVLVGNIASSSINPWVFYAGSVTASVAWFSCLAGLGKPLSKVLISPNRWRVFDGILCVIMSFMAFSLWTHT